MKNLGKIYKIKPYLAILITFAIFTQHLWAKNDKNFDFNLSINKNEVYVGESLRVTFVFKHKIGLNIAEANFAPPTFNGFWVKPGKDAPNIIKDGYNIYTLHYLITPQKAGFLKIEPARMDIGIVQRNQKNTLRFERVKYKSIFSNSLEIKAKDLPHGVNIFGDYNISVKVDKTTVLANQPINLTLKIYGEGNIDEIEEFFVNNHDATVFSDTAKRTSGFINGKNGGEMIQKFAFISDRNFTIEPFSLKFFDSKEKKIKTIRTKPVKITVTGKNANKNPTLQKAKRLTFEQSGSKTALFLVSIVSFLLGIGAKHFYMKRENSISKNKSLSIKEKIKKSKNQKSLLQLLLPYKGRYGKIDDIIKKIEENIYEGKNHKIDKKKLVKNLINIFNES